MKKIIFIAASVLFCVFSLVLSSCSDDDDAKQSVAKPVVALAEVGKENSKEAIAGKDLHLEGDLVADGLIARIDVTIAAKNGNKTIVKQSYTEGKYIGVRNTTFHEHLDIPADAAPGAYTVTFVVTDKLVRALPSLPTLQSRHSTRQPQPLLSRKWARMIATRL